MRLNILFFGYIQKIYDKIDLDDEENLEILSKISDLLISKSEILTTHFVGFENISNLGRVDVKKILNLKNDFDIMKQSLENIKHNVKPTGFRHLCGEFFVPLDYSYDCMEDLISLGRFFDAINYFYSLHQYGQCNYRCNCHKHLHKLKRWVDIIKFYNYIDNELTKTELFIDFVDNAKKKNLLSDEELLSLSYYIHDRDNQHIFIKNIRGANLTSAYKSILVT